MHCNICGGGEFGDAGGRIGVRCSSCGSFERTRLLWLYVEKWVKLAPGTRVLHLAPELGIYRRISAVVHEDNYDIRDLFPENFPFAKGVGRMDLCDLGSLPSDHYDLILHCHVLEHVPCNIAHSLYHLHRSLKPEGHHLFVVPFLPGRYEESFQEIPVDERVRRFGQDDHVRRFGKDDVHAHLGSLVELDAGFDAEADHGAAGLEAANIPPACWRGLTPHTVIHLGKGDMKLR